MSDLAAGFFFARLFICLVDEFFDAGGRGGVTDVVVALLDYPGNILITDHVLLLLLGAPLLPPRILYGIHHQIMARLVEFARKLTVVVL